MIINQISLKNYRNYDSLKIKFNNKINIIIGENAQGKTNILESIYFLSITKSYRTNDDHNLIQIGKDYFHIMAKMKDGSIPRSLAITYSKKGKNILLNNNSVKKISDFVGILLVVIMAPDDVEMIKGSPTIRRNVLNIELSKISKEYLEKYNEYNKLLKIRNDYLKMLYTSSVADGRYLEIVTEKLIERACYIYQERKKFIDEINASIELIYRDISGIDHLSIEYIPNIELNDYQTENIMKQMKKFYNKYRQKEIALGMTLYGPHRDDFEFRIDHNNMKFYGSQGQQKTAVISFKLALLQCFQQRVGKTPVLLLDDIFSELDHKRKNKLLEYIVNAGQVIITTNDIRNVNKKKLVNTTVFEIKNRKIIEKGDINGNRK